MNLWIVGALLVVIAAAGILLRKILGETRREENVVKRVRTTDLYGHLYPMLKKYDSEFVESVSIRPEGLLIRLMIPMGTEVRYTFARHSLDEPSQETLYALAQAVMVDMHVLRNERHYTFRTHTEKDAGGRDVYWYDYMVRRSRKETVLQGEARKNREKSTMG